MDDQESGQYRPEQRVDYQGGSYVFDFAPDRALRQIADYSCRLNINESNPENKVEEFIRFLPVLAYDSSSIQRLMNSKDAMDALMSIEGFRNLNQDIETIIRAPL